MARLKITKTDGEVSIHQITPAIEYAFELKYQGGIHKIFREHERQSDVYFLAWECLRKSGQTVPMFGVEFLESLREVEVLDDEKNG
jgi:hypothetical protein